MSKSAVASGVWARGPLLHGLSQPDLDAVGARMVARRFAAGDLLIRQGVWCGELFLLRDGVVEVMVERAESAGKDAGEVPIQRMVGGDIVGEMSLITGSLPSATVRALTDVEALVLTQEDFLRLAFELPVLSHNINGILSDRLRRSNLQKVETGSRQIIAAIGGEPDVWRDLAGVLAWLMPSPVLFVDLADGDETGYSLSDLVQGRVRSGAGPHDTENLTVVNSVGEEGVDLSTLLGRLGEAYRHVLISLPPDSPLITSRLLAYTSRVLIALCEEEAGSLRRIVDDLPGKVGRLDLGAVLTGVSGSAISTVAAIEWQSTRVGIPVHALLPADVTSRQDRIEALGRMLAGQRIGLALGAGGPKGWAHLGVLHALRAAGVPIDCLTGVSIGAIVAAAVAMERPLEWIEGRLAVAGSRVFRPAFPLRGVLTNRPAGRWLRKEIYGEQLIEETAIPLALSAADLNEGSEIVLRRGPLWQAVLASTAIPGIYPAVRVGRHWLVDGGVVNPVPVGTARLLGADVVIGVDLSVSLIPRHEPDQHGPVAGRPPLILNNILRSRDIMMSVIQAHSVAEPSVLVKPAVEGIPLRNFGRGSRFMTAGEVAMEAALPTLRQQLPWLGKTSSNG